jgi:hypothetical protein
MLTLINSALIASDVAFSLSVAATGIIATDGVAWVLFSQSDI